MALLAIGIAVVQTIVNYLGSATVGAVALGSTAASGGTSTGPSSHAVLTLHGKILDVVNLLVCVCVAVVAVVEEVRGGLLSRIC